MKELKISDDLVFLLNITSVISTDEDNVHNYLNDGYRIIRIQQKFDSNGLIVTYYTIGK